MIRQLIGCIVILVVLAGTADAHTLVCQCLANGDGTVTCEPGFSDGSSAAGTRYEIIVKDKIVASGMTDELGEFTFTAPDQPYSVRVDGGPGHEATIPSAWVRK
jgi:hypothetical protein